MYSIVPQVPHVPQVCIWETWLCNALHWCTNHSNQKSIKCQDLQPTHCQCTGATAFAQSIFVLWSTLVALYYAVSVHSKEDPPASISRHPPSQREPAFKSTKYLIIWRTGLSLIKSVHWYLQHLRQVLKGQTVNKAWIFWEYYSRSQDNLNWTWLSLRTSFISQGNPRPLAASSQVHVRPEKGRLPLWQKKW